MPFLSVGSADGVLRAPSCPHHILSVESTISSLRFLTVEQNLEDH